MDNLAAAHLNGSTCKYAAALSKQICIRPESFAAAPGLTTLHTWSCVFPESMQSCRLLPACHVLWIERPQLRLYQGA